MPISIDWDLRIIAVPQSYLTLVSGAVYQLDTDQFRLDLKTLEAGSPGMSFPKTHNHNTTLVLSGITYARSVEFVNNYTITFEPGAYAVVLSGSNNNIIDVTNFNGVSVLGNNSAGLIDASLIADNVETLLFNEHVHINVNEGVPGTTGEIGSHGHPVNNLPDAITIATTRHLGQFMVEEDLTIGATDNIDGYIVNGAHAIKSEITLTPGCSTTLSQFNNCQLTGTADGPVVIRECLVSDLDGFAGIIFQCAIAGYVSPVGAGTAMILQSYAEAPEVESELDMSLAGAGVAIRDWNGPLKLTNNVGGYPICVDYAAARILVDGSVTTGNVHITGSGGLVTDNSGGTAVVDVTGAMTADQLADVYTLLGLNVDEVITITPAGADSASGDIDINFTGDGVAITTMTRQP
jgi:hypothetical protein